MQATLNRFTMSDLARNKRVEVPIGGDGAELTPAHTVGHAIDHYLDANQIRDRSLRWTAFSRGIMLDSKTKLDELESTDSEWTVMPEVSAG
jgi:hypothetical protein